MFWIVSAAALVLPLFASAEVIETCHFDGRIVLESQTEIECWKNQFVIEDGSEIVTNGNQLLVFSDGTMDLKGLKIRSFEGDGSGSGRDAGRVTIEATTLTGRLSVLNDAQANGSGGEIVLKTLTFKGFKKPVFSVNGAGEGRAGGIWIYTSQGRIAASSLSENSLE